jgi:hypothetical protein
MKIISIYLMVAMLLLALPGLALSGDSDPPMSSTNYAITWSALEESHGGSSGSGSFRMETAVVGQMVAQETSHSDGYSLCAGYSCYPLVGYTVFLPLVIRN